MDTYIGEIRIFPYNFIPRGWAACDGSLMSISTNSALYSLLGTQFGGNGQTTFGLPDLRGRGAVSQNPSYPIGTKAGTENVTLSVTQIPAHNHLLNVSNLPATAAVNNVGPIETIADPVINSITGLNINSFSPNNSNLVPISPLSISSAGGSIGHENRVPLLALTICICTQGMYPSRS
jgi:microcystin-dependent protein